MTKPNILAIDDNPTNLLVLGGALQEAYSLRTATSGVDGLALAIADPPDLILLDVLMPDMSGLEVAGRLRADPVLANIPVIFITAAGDQETEIACLQMGAADFIHKPINLPIAHMRIRNLIEREDLRKRVECHRDQLDEQVRERTLALSIAKEAAESADRFKTLILTNLNHEFRTPLNIVLGMVGLGIRKGQDPKVTEYLEKAQIAGKQLQGLLINLLELSMIESGHLTLERQDIHWSQLAIQATQEAQAKAASKGLALQHRHLAGTEPMHGTYGGDAQRIRQIVDELIGNAIKFSERGTVTVQTGLETLAEGKAWLVLQVNDEGIGIAEKDHQAIFAAFAQLDPSSTRRHGGNGIGLHLCKRLAEGMGGKINLASALGQGASFELRLPAEP